VVESVKPLKEIWRPPVMEYTLPRESVIFEPLVPDGLSLTTGMLRRGGPASTRLPFIESLICPLLISFTLLTWTIAWELSEVLPSLMLVAQGQEVLDDGRHVVNTIIYPIIRDILVYKKYKVALNNTFNNEIKQIKVLTYSCIARNSSVVLQSPENLLPGSGEGCGNGHIDGDTHCSSVDEISSVQIAWCISSLVILVVVWPGVWCEQPIRVIGVALCRCARVGLEMAGVHGETQHVLDRSDTWRHARRVAGGIKVIPNFCHKKGRE
jgi:hypothetical protein